MLFATDFGGAGFLLDCSYGGGLLRPNYFLAGRSLRLLPTTRRGRRLKAFSEYLRRHSGTKLYWSALYCRGLDLVGISEA